ncbi:MAG: Transglutaminase-like enzyme putative cysteine protease [Chthonomonadaceae bacterium]|nr:Transglutaminase-like enzyme putative cysteine protease [Chthonomonadaceae bacterium]
MTVFDPQAPTPDGQDPARTGRITVSMRSDSTRTGEAEGPVSPWLYIAGALVTLAALYAVNFSMEDSGFALLTYVLAIGGYGSSYFLRVRGISLRGLQVPLLTLLGFFFLLSLLFGQGVGVAESPSRNLQIALTWVAILHSYTLSNNAAVLFACVPGMTLIALVSTSTTEVEAQNAFLVFFCAATFLLVHENYLRTQANTVPKSAAGRRPTLFTSQFALATGCFLGAMLLGHVTEKPMQFVGERLFPQGTINAIRGRIQTNLPTSLTGNERTNYELASGPVSATDTPVLEVKCDEPLYWRGGTYDKYTGHSFSNSFSTVLLEQKGVNRYEQQPVDPNQEARNHFKISPDSTDLKESEMTGSRRVRQHFTMLAVSTPQMYGAARVEELDSSVYSINTDNVGALSPIVPLQAKAEYDVVSVVPTFSEQILKAASTDRIPPDIALFYLQLPTPENPILAQLAAEWTRGKKNNYEKALAIQRNIAATCRYNLNTPAAPRDKDIVAYFLTESKQGYCDSFGAAMTVMCRYAGIPARMALGFLHGEETAPHTYLVKDKDRHIWTEVFFPKVGWVKFDATEGAEDITPTTETAHKQKLSLMAWLSQQGIGPKLIELIMVVLLAYLVKTELIDRIRPRHKEPGARAIVRPATNMAIHNAYNAAVRQLARKGLHRTANMTAVEFRTMVQGLTAPADLGAALTELTEMHNRYYYGNETAPAEEVTRAQAALQRLTESSRAYRGESGKTGSMQRSEAV